MQRFEGIQDLAARVASLQAATGTAGAKRVEDIIDIVKKGLQVHRARLIADEHFIKGTSQRTIAATQNVSVNAVSLWLKEHGPKEYVSVRQEGGEFVVERVAPRAVRGLIGAGRRVAPAVWAVDHAENVDPQKLWHDLASQA